MRKLILSFVPLLLVIAAFAQPATVQRPKLVVGIVVDQMRWDYLYRYYDRYDANGGFKRFLNQGFSCENTFIPYVPTITACGHTTIFTGAPPAISGIVGNTWWDKDQMRVVYCTEDNSASSVGSNTTLGKMSPKNMLVTSICDELRIATNFRSKVIGIAIKDRGGILPAGHSANGAYWYDNSTGDWISSTYYMNSLPKWVSDFNGQKLVDKYFQGDWKLLYDANTYVQSTADEKKYESKALGTRFPFDLKKIERKYPLLAMTPYGNSFTTEFAKASINAEQLGADDITDFLTVSYSAPDYIGHNFGPNSLEAEDGFLRLDRELASLFDYLDTKVGKGQYTAFLSADHGVSQIPEFLKENKLPGGRVFVSALTESMNRVLRQMYNLNDIIVSDDNYQIHLNHTKLDSAKLNKKEITQWIVDRLNADSGVYRAFPLADLNLVPLPGKIRDMINNGYYPRRNGDIQVLLQPNHIDAYSNTGTTHGLWNPYDSHIPLLWYGWGIKQGKTNRETYMTDVAATVAALLHIQMPSGSIGHVIEEVLK